MHGQPDRSVVEHSECGGIPRECGPVGPDDVVEKMLLPVAEGDGAQVGRGDQGESGTCACEAQAIPLPARHLFGQPEQGKKRIARFPRGNEHASRLHEIVKCIRRHGAERGVRQRPCGADDPVVGQSVDARNFIHGNAESGEYPPQRHDLQVPGGTSPRRTNVEQGHL